MLKLFKSSDLTELANALLAELNRRTSQNPLQPETFVVQNYGMARWLSLFIADQEGVAANLEFKFPAEVYWQMMKVMDPDIPESLSSDRIPMRWAIFEILLDDRMSSLTILQRYVENPDPKKREMRCWNLAGRIADVFDQYLTYRPKMLRKWEEEDGPTFSTNFVSEKWQASLWRKLNNRWNKMEGKIGNHRAALEQELVKKIESRDLPTEQLPSRISVFGVSEMPEVYIKTLVRLSKLTDIHFYTVNSSQNIGNSLVQSLGKVGVEYEQMIDHHIEEDESRDDIEQYTLEGNIAELQNLFQVVKHNLLGGKKPESIPVDDSIMIHSCHSARREVEVLYDQLLQMLNENETLQPADIMVFCPTMDEYGPEIEAVFGAPEEGIPQIPYHLAETASEANIIDLAFRKLLQIVDSRFKVTDVLDLMDNKPIRQAFSFSNDDANTLEKWIGDNRIHWGINGEQKQALNVPTAESFTWRAGMHRMMAGYAMQRADDSLFEQIYPYDEIQQTEDAQLLGRFSHFMHVLFDAHQHVKAKKTLSEWSELFNNWITAFFPEQESYFSDTQKLRNIIQSLVEQQELADVKSHISFRVVRSYLEGQLEQKATGGGRPGRGVTFSGMVPMRNIPAKAVCMIGMNDGSFPRGKEAVEFNLITKNPREGDRLPGKEDRQIFLENILAAEDRLYFSYIGQSNKKEVKYPPSVVLRELVDYLIEGYEINENKLIQEHKLQPFSKTYFINNLDGELFSFSSKNCNTASQLTDATPEENEFLVGSLSEPKDTFKKLSINELVAFFQHPAKFLLQQRLGIYLHEDEVLDEDREHFALGGLDRYHLGQEMLDRYLEDTSSVQNYKKIAFAEDLLPEGWPGNHAFDMQERLVKEFGRNIQRELDHRKLEPIEVDLQLGDFEIYGQLDRVYEHRLLLFRFGRLRAKDVIDLWVRHLLLQSVRPSGHSGQSRLYSRDKSKGITFAQLNSVDNHLQILEDLLQKYWLGLHRDTMLYPNSSFAYAKKVLHKNKDEEQGLKAARKEWADDFSDYDKEGDDPYIKRLMRNRNPFDHNKLAKLFKQVSVSFWEPFFNELNKSEEGEV